MRKGLKEILKNNFILKGLIVGFLVGTIFIPILLIARITPPLLKNSLLSLPVLGITVIIKFVYGFPLTFYSIVDDVFLRARNDLLLVSFIISFYSIFGLVMGIIYHTINKKNKILAKTILFVIILLFLIFNLFLSNLTIG